MARAAVRAVSERTVRHAPAYVTCGLLVLALAGCRSSDPDTTPSPRTGDECRAGGDVHFLQGQPADLPGGGSGGIGQIKDTDPATVNLALGGGDVRAERGLGVGDTFAVAGTTYRITCISSSSVTADVAGRTATPRPTVCRGGDVRLRTGSRTSLPGGDTAGVDQVDDRGDALAVYLALGSAGSYDDRATGRLVVGDEFAINETSYRIDCISTRLTTLDRVP